MKRYMIDLADKRYTVDIQDLPDGSMRVLVGDRWYTVKASPGTEVGQDWGDTSSRIQRLPPVINTTMPEQPAPVFNMSTPVVNISIPKQAAPVVNIPQHEIEPRPAPTSRVMLLSSQAAVSPDLKCTASLSRPKKELLSDCPSLKINLFNQLHA